MDILSFFDKKAKWKDLPEQVKTLFLRGSGGEEIEFRYDEGGRIYSVSRVFEGVMPDIELHAQRVRRSAQTIGLNPPVDATISRNEVFGPAVCVYAYTDVDAVIAQANSLDVAFQAAIFTNDLASAMHTYRNIDASAVMVNDHTAFRVDWMPFGGRRHSGYGVGGIGHTLRDMTQEKMAVIKL